MYKNLPKIVFKINANFLNAISCNSLDKSRNALLDKFGRVIVCFEQIKDNDDVFCVVDLIYAKKFTSRVEEMDTLKRSNLERTSLKAVHYIDEDVDCKKIPMNIGYYGLVKEIPSREHEISNDVYEQIRIQNKIAWQGIDFTNEMFLEANIDDSVSYTKGCYPGQEVMARVHNLGKPPKLLKVLKYSIEPKSITSNGEEVGVITSKIKVDGGWLVFAKIKNQDSPIDDAEVV